MSKSKYAISLVVGFLILLNSLASYGEWEWSKVNTTYLDGQLGGPGLIAENQRDFRLTGNAKYPDGSWDVASSRYSGIWSDLRPVSDQGNRTNRKY